VNSRSQTSNPLPRLLLLDLLVERSEFGHGGNLEVIRPFVDALGRVEVWLLTPQFQTIESQRAAAAAFSRVDRKGTRGDIEGDVAITEGFVLLKELDVPEWDEAVEFIDERWVEIGVGSVLLRRVALPSDVSQEWMSRANPLAVVCSGSRRNITTWAGWMAAAESVLRKSVDLHLPTLGICFGHQLLCRAMGGRIERFESSTEAILPIELNRDGRTDPLLSDLGQGQAPHGLYTHQEHVVKLGRQTRVLAASAHTKFAVVRVEADDGSLLPSWGVQFHPEATEARISGAVQAGHLSEEEAAAFVGEHDGPAFLQAFAREALRIRNQVAR
jgi:GMP synthase-like glutamine amidotransferase